MRVAVKFAYNGIQYHGYARQPNLGTIEGSIIDLLTNEGLFVNPKDAKFRSASRTDKGVSALGNVISFDLNDKAPLILSELNTNKDIVFYGYRIVENDFYPRYANLRIYRYYLHKEKIDFDKVINSLSLFIGTHDFSNFARIEPYKNPLRTIENITIEEIQDFYVIDFYAQTYLWHQIRRIISAIKNVNQGKIKDEDIIHALKQPEKKIDFGVASPEPLVLKDIEYSFSFKIDKKEEKKVMKLESFLVDQIKCLSY
jgi:tRNA pseudouridine38-40 synthase